MPLERQPGPPRVVVDRIEGRDALYELELSAPPSPIWRAAFRRPPSHLTGPNSTPDFGRLYLPGATVYFRTAPRRLDGWLRRIDGWIADANSVVESGSVERVAQGRRGASPKPSVCRCRGCCSRKIVH